MVKVKIVFGIFWMFSMCISDELIDDFERGIAQNYRNLYWYYFSDVKDGGNSVIKDVDILPNGSYSEPLLVLDSIKGSLCAVIRYVIGDSIPINGDYEYDPFVGIGTDLAKPGNTVDISSCYGVSFEAKVNAKQSKNVVFELVTSNIYDYCYRQQEFVVSADWQTFFVEFNDSTNFRAPGYANGRQMRYPLVLSKVQKMNWRIMETDSGSLYIDNIKLLNHSVVATKMLNFTPYKKCDQIEMFSDLIGRNISSFIKVRRTTDNIIVERDASGSKKIIRIVK
jgi:hypothetical protein